MKKGFMSCGFTVIIMCTSLYQSDMTFAACTVSTTPVIFGNYDIFSPMPLDASGSVSVRCDEQRPPRVSIAIGPSPSGAGFYPRIMNHVSETDVLSYNLYIDSNRRQIWGDGSGNTFTRIRRVNRNHPRVETIYGRVPPLQDVGAGSYTDTLTVTITW